jgi:hypothetical protein
MRRGVGGNFTARAGLSSNVRTRTTSFKLEVNARKLERLPEEAKKRVRDAVSKATVDVQAETQLTIRTKNIIDTGNLLNSVTASMSLDGLTGYVNIGAYYGIYIEFGTVKRAARPFLAPSVETIGPGFIAAVRQAVREAAEQA